MTLCRFFINPYREQDPQWESEISAPFKSRDVLDLHRSLDVYQPTPLVSLPDLARRLGMGKILVKDESKRFGLNAFKALGASYAVYKFLHRHYKERGRFVSLPRNFYRNPGAVEPDRFTFCTATDGNHGRGVAWTARQLRQRSVIFMPANTVASRVDNVEMEGARVLMVDGTYDDTVAAMAEQAEKNGWQIISDMSWPGYEEIPRWIMAGYTTLFDEVDRSLGPKERIDIAIIPGGCGALAGTAAWHYNKVFGASRPKLVAVEPTDADCLMESMRSKDGRVCSLKGGQTSIMAGLNCGTPSPVAWPLIRSGFDLFLTVPDGAAVEAMRTYHHSLAGDPAIVSGESGAAALAALTTLMTKPSVSPARKSLSLGPDSTVLLLNTEGDTDPEHYSQVIAS
jgi:diaminopropionate ammonia-lyase